MTWELVEENEVVYDWGNERRGKEREMKGEGKLVWKEGRKEVIGEQVDIERETKWKERQRGRSRDASVRKCK